MEPVELVVLVELEVLVELAEQSWQHAGIGNLIQKAGQAIQMSDFLSMWKL